MSDRIKTLCCLLLFALAPLTMGGCPGQDAFVGGVADGVTQGVAAVIENFFADALDNDG